MLPHHLRSYLIILFLVPVLWVLCSENLFLCQCVQDCSLTSSSIRFSGSGFILRSLIHIESCFVLAHKYGSVGMLLQAVIQFVRLVLEPWFCISHNIRDYMTRNNAHMRTCTHALTHRHTHRDMNKHTLLYSLHSHTVPGVLLYLG